MADRPTLAKATALSAALGYGLVPALVKFAHLNGVPPIDSTLFRTLAAVVAYAVIVRTAGYRIAITRGNFWPMLALTAATFTISTGYLASVQFIPVGLAVIIFFTFPVALLLASPLVERRPIGAWRLALAALGFLGLAIAIGPSTGSLDPRGIILAAMAAAGAVVQFFSARALGGSMHPVAFGLVAHVGFLPAAFALAWWLDGGGIAALHPAGVTVTGYATLAAVCALYVVSFFLQMRALSLAPATTVAPFFNLEPVTTIAVAALMLGETLTLNQYLGGAMVLAAVVAVGFGDRLAPRARATHRSSA
ncbi:MAG: EamA family transporter [Hyphomicrobiales bacterium]